MILNRERERGGGKKEKKKRMKEAREKIGNKVSSSKHSINFSIT